MMAKPMKTFELYYPMIRFLIISDIPQFKLGNIRSRDVFRPIARERKYLMDYNYEYEAYFIVFSMSISGLSVVRYRLQGTSVKL